MKEPTVEVIEWKTKDENLAVTTYVCSDRLTFDVDHFLEGLLLSVTVDSLDVGHSNSCSSIKLKS